MYLKITAVYVMIIFALGRSLHPKKYISKISSRSLYSCKLSGDDSSKSLTATESTVLQYLSSKCKLTADSYVLLAVSGGLDSMAMLHILSKVSRLYLPLNLEVISFNHKLRPESDEEVSFVSSWAQRYNLVFHERILPENQRSLIGLQARSREWRRKECFQVLKDYNSKINSISKDSSNIAIEQGSFHNENMNNSTPDLKMNRKSVVFATAHHADDQHETIMLKFLRGAYISNLQPMLPRSDCDRIVHPLLGVTKGQLEDYMKTADFPWREDSSNTLRKYKRNIVRLDLLPIMEDLAGGPGPMNKRFEALAEQSNELQTWLDYEADKFLNKEIPTMIANENNMNKYKEIATENSENNRLNEIIINIDKKSVFSMLPSPLIQREILQRIYKSISGGKMLNYEMTCKLLNLINDDIGLGKKDKAMQLDKDILAVKMGGVLLVKSGDEINGRDDRGDRNNREGVDLEFENHVILGNITVTVPKGLEIHINSEMKDIRMKNELNVILIKSLGIEGGLSSGGFDSNSPIATTTSAYLYNIPKNSHISIRFPKSGDVFQPEWKKGPIRIVEFLRVKKVPLHLRSLVPVIELSHPCIENNDSDNSTILLDDSTINLDNDDKVEMRGEIIQDCNGINTEIISIPPYVTKKYMTESVINHLNIDNTGGITDMSHNIDDKCDTDEKGVSFQITVSLKT